MAILEIQPKVATGFSSNYTLHIVTGHQYCLYMLLGVAINDMIQFDNNIEFMLCMLPDIGFLSVHFSIHVGMMSLDVRKCETYFH